MSDRRRPPPPAESIVVPKLHEDDDEDPTMPLSDTAMELRDAFMNEGLGTPPEWLADHYPHEALATLRKTVRPGEPEGTEEEDDEEVPSSRRTG
jgi:hypothetical protein